MPPRRSPAAVALAETLYAQPAGIRVFVVDGIERLVFSTSDVAQLLFGTPADANEAKRHRERVLDYHRRRLIGGKKVGNNILIPGSALAEFVDWLNTTTEGKTD